MRAKWITVVAMAAYCGIVLGQSATVTATIVDSDSQAWVTQNGFNAKYTIQLINSTTGAPIPGGQAYRKDTGATITNSFSGNLDGTGAFSVSLTEVSYILPSNVTWQFTVCPAVSSPTCGTVNIPVNASGSVSAKINAVISAPRITGGTGAFAYADVEVAASANNTYYNTTTPACRYYSTSWGVCGSGGGGPPTGAAGGVLSGSYPNPGLNASGVALPNSSTATTQSAGDTSTDVATDAFAAGVGTAAQAASVANVFPANIQLTVDGASVTAGYNPGLETYISAQSGGSSYTGTGGAVAFTNGTCTITPVVQAYVETNATSYTTGPIIFAQTTAGACSVVPTTYTLPVGLTGGSGATLTMSTYASPYPNPWPTLLTTEPVLNGKVASFTNNAVNSAVITGVTNSVASRFQSLGYATTCASGSHNEYFLLGGDIAQNAIGGFTGGTAASYAATAYGEWVALAHAIKAAGCKLIVTTPIPRGNSANPNDGPTQAIAQGIQLFSSMLRNGKVGVDYDYLIDHGALIQDTSDANFFYQGDFTHPLSGGHQMMADIANAALTAGGGTHAIAAPWINPIYGGNGYFYGSLGSAGQISTSVNGGATTSPFYTTGTFFSPCSSSVFPLWYLDQAPSNEPSFNSNCVAMGWNFASGVSANANIMEAHQHGGNQIFSINMGGGFFGTQTEVTSTGVIGFGNGTTVGGTKDTILCRSGAAGVMSVESAASCTNTVAGGTGTLALAAIDSNATQSTVSCSTSGSAIFSQPFQAGTADKRVLIHMSACLGTASYTYPTAFTNTPSVYASNNVAASIASAVSTTAVTVTGTTTTGSLVLEDY